MAKVAREATLPVEYCAFMVAIMMSRYVVDRRKPNVQQSPEKVAETLNSLEYGLKGNLCYSGRIAPRILFIQEDSTFNGIRYNRDAWEGETINRLLYTVRRETR